MDIEAGSAACHAIFGPLLDFVVSPCTEPLCTCWPDLGALVGLNMPGILEFLSNRILASICFLFHAIGSIGSFSFFCTLNISDEITILDNPPYMCPDTRRQSGIWRPLTGHTQTGPIGHYTPLHFMRLWHHRRACLIRHTSRLYHTRRTHTHRLCHTRRTRTRTLPGHRRPHTRIRIRHIHTRNHPWP